MEESLVRRLRAIVGEEGAFAEADRLLVYESDGLTQYRHPPGGVVLPRTTDEVSRILALLHQEGRAFVARGSGTGLSGGALAPNGSIVVGTARMNRILELDPPNRRARVQPGVINADLTKAALPHGLIYAPDPSSQSACTLGGNVAENSGGPHCLKYGVTTRYVTGLTVVLADGEVVQLGGMGRDMEGLDLVGVFVGSEGCFGIATEIEVQLIPVAEGVRTLLGIFDSMEAAGRAVTDMMARGLLPAALEIVDAETIRAVEASVYAAGYPTDAAAALIVEVDGMDATLDGEMKVAADCCRAAGAREVRTAKDTEERLALWRGRKKAFGAMGRLAPDLLVQDATVPRTKLPEVLARVDEIGKKHGLLVANVFHAGDGNLHPNLLFDRRIEDQVRRVEVASREIMEVCIRAGGTITGEHGVGIDKRSYMPLVCSADVLGAMSRVKEAFDPLGRSNPGKVLPDGYWPPAVAPRPEGGLPKRGRPEPEDVLDRVRSLLGAGGASLDERGVRAAPRTDEEVAALLRVAAESGWRVRPAGAGIGSLPDDGDLLVSTSGMTELLEHEPADLMCRVRAGHSLGALQAALASERQWLALDPPGGDAVTLGGIAASGIPGPLQSLYGRPRDQVLGLTVVDGAGRVLRLGGRVVKNVAGFDLVRLAVGSRGSLGLITELTLRLYPSPEADRTLIWSWDTLDEAWAMGRRLARLPLPIGAAELLGGLWDAPLNDSFFRVAVRLLGSQSAVERMSEALMDAAGLPLREVKGDQSRNAHRVLSEGAATRGRRFRLQMLPDRGTALGSSLKEIPYERFALHLLTGTVRGLIRPDAKVDEIRPAEAGADRLRDRVTRAFDPYGILAGRSAA